MTLYVPFDQGDGRLGGWLVTQRLDSLDKQRETLTKLRDQRMEHSSNPCRDVVLGSGQWSDFGEFFFGGSTQLPQVATVYKGLGKKIMGERYRDPGEWLYFDFEWAEGARPSEDSDPSKDNSWRGSSMHLPLLLASWTFLHPQDDPEHDLVVFATGEITGSTRQDFAIQPADQEAIRNKARGFLEHLKSVQKKGLMLVSVHDVGWLRDGSGETYPEALSVTEHAKIVAALRGANENPVLVSYAPSELVDIIALLEKISAPTERRPHFDGLCWKHTEQPVGWVGDPCTVPGCGLHLIPRKLAERAHRKYKHDANEDGSRPGHLGYRLAVDSKEVILTKILNAGSQRVVYLARMKNSKGLFHKSVVVKLAFMGAGVTFDATAALARESGVLQKLDEISPDRRDACQKYLMRLLGYSESARGHHGGIAFECSALIREYNSRLRPLSVVLEKSSDISQRAKLIHALLEGVDTLHKEQIFHGDLKPGNILVDRQDLSTIKFIDMATTTVLKVTGDVTNTSTQFSRAQSHNTRLYAPPEILLGSPHGTKEGDLFSLGLVLVEIVSNRRLSRILGLKEGTRKERPKNWSETLQSTVSSEVWALLEALLSMKAEERTLENLVSVDWEALLSGNEETSASGADTNSTLPVVVQKPTHPLGSETMGHQKPAIWVMMIGLIVILVVGLPVTFWTLSNQRTAAATEPTPPVGTLAIKQLPPPQVRAPTQPDTNERQAVPTTSDDVAVGDSVGVRDNVRIGLDYYEKAKQAFDAEDFQAAADLLEMAYAEDPELIYQYNRIRAFQAMGQHEEAAKVLKIYKNPMSRDPENFSDLPQIEAQIKEALENKAITNSTISKTLERKSNAFLECYEQELRKDPKARGEVVVVFVVDSTGRVTSSKVTADGVGGKVGVCVSQTISQFKFERPEGDDATVRWSFVFSPGLIFPAK